MRGRGQEAGGEIRFGERWGRDEGAAVGVWQCQGKVERSKEPRTAFPVLWCAELSTPRFLLVG